MTDLEATQVAAGDIIAGKYRVDRVLGAGGMGIVVAAHHVQLDEKVAIKFLLPGALGDSEVVERFAREARAAVKIKSDHVARVRDVGTLETGAPYMVMEYLEGHDLSREIETRRLGVDEAVDYLLQACEAIAEAHVLGIVHRDLKPANLFLTRRSGGLGWVKVLDFGISKMSSLGAAGHMTNTSAVLGSPFYMSPEQLRSSRDVDARADIWSLGVIAYELLARHVPFRGESIAELCVSILNDAPPSLAAVRPDVPAGLEAGIFKCLEKNRDRRFPNVAELALALRPFARERGRVSVDNIARTLSSAGVSLSDSSTESIRNPAVAPAHARDAMPSYHTGSSSSGSGTKGESSGAAVATTDKQATHAAWGNTGTTRRGNGVVAAVAGGFVLLVAGLGFAAWRLASAVVQPEDTATLRSADVQAIGAPSSKPAAAPPRATAAPAIDIAPVPSAAPAAEETASANAAEPVELAAPRQVVRAVKTPTRVATGPKTPPKQEPEVAKAPPKTEGTATTRPAAGLLDGRH